MLIYNFIFLTDSTFPGVNELFTFQSSTADGHEKWLDFAIKFWNAECARSFRKSFYRTLSEMVCKSGYYFSKDKVVDIYAAFCGYVGIFPKDDTTDLLIRQSVMQLNSICASIAVIAEKMFSLAAMLPEYPVVMSLFGF